MYRSGYNYMTVITAEDTFGVVNQAAAYPDVDVLLDTVNFRQIGEKVDVKAKPLTLEPQKWQAALGNTSAEVTMSGILTKHHDILFRMLLLDNASASPFLVGADQGTKYSWTITQYFTNTPVKCHIHTGCVLKTLKLTGNPGETITYEATFVAKSSVMEQDKPWTTLTPTAPSDYAPMIFCQSGSSVLGEIKLEKFTLDFTNNFIDDKLQFMNACERQEVISIGVEIKYSTDIPYDTAHIYPDYFTPDTLTNLTLELSDQLTPTNSISFDMNAQLEDKNFADPDRGRYTSSLVWRVCGDTGVAPCEVTFAP